ncbi:DUF6668 family protein [Allobranchiibius sp. GilTou38]|uniref:DUF6668 family protein n=1 Tax=Allobranchiibius sp. GilTou38 TaxID=2815210 RepID=UPI001AA0C6A6|nr:DUF6668 family protein [Allobranchiibius sp. GilTou38]MBO1768259.1 hypothetical protein [Allobranchiibius sp. GilTou38]
MSAIWEGCGVPGSVLLSRGRKDPAPVNPFLPAAPPPEPVQEAMPVDELLGENLQATGPARPLGIQAPAGASLPRLFAGPEARTHVVGLHGGAGVTTVGQLLSEAIAVDAGTKVPLGGTPRVLLAARTHAAGLAAVQRAGQVWAGGQLSDVELLGLVLVDDGPRMSKAQLAGCRQVMQILPRTWRIGWVEPWRTQTVPEISAAPLRVRRTVNQLRALCVPAATERTT